VFPALKMRCFRALLLVVFRRLLSFLVARLAGLVGEDYVSVSKSKCRCSDDDTGAEMCVKISCCAMRCRMVGRSLGIEPRPYFVVPGWSHRAKDDDDELKRMEVQEVVRCMNLYVIVMSPWDVITSLRVSMEVECHPAVSRFVYLSV
jgi:hypothetical protein